MRFAGVVRLLWECLANIRDCLKAKFQTRLVATCSEVKFLIESDWPHITCLDP